jgi:hypothetical protein
MKTRREMIDAFLRPSLLARDERFFEGDANAAEGNSSSPTYPLCLRARPATDRKAPAAMPDLSALSAARNS